MKHVAALLALSLVSSPVLADDSREEAAETEERSPVWFGAFVASSVVAVTGIGVYAYSYKALGDEVELIRVSDPSQGTITNEDCGNPNIRDLNGHFEAACKWSNRSRIAFFTTVVALPFAIATGYLAFRSLPKKEKRSVALIPTVTTQSAGAMLDIRW